MTLIAVLILVLISSIMLGAAMPLWTTVVKREKEEELIYRGEQYVRAIEEFQLTVGRPPNKLEELIEYKTIDQKRFIRKLYEDPMAEDGKWALIYADAGTFRGRGANPRSRGRRGQGEEDEQAESRGREPAEEPSGPSTSDVRYAMPGRASKQQLKGGFILGVKSKNKDESLKIYQGKEAYNDWESLRPDVPSSPVTSPMS
ncbi:hypothetical protein ACFLU6_15425, partial [Acidobacteriota bacterium]